MKTKITLQLGDIIEIISLSNISLHEKVFVIDYINSEKIVLLNDETSITLTLTESVLDDESITQINLLSRSEELGYSRQNNLIPKQWIDIHFSGDIPQIITGEITNLEDDMIEIKVYPTNDIIYIDFEYKGIPEDIPIEKIILRNKPIDIEGDIQDKEITQGELQLDSVKKTPSEKPKDVVDFKKQIDQIIIQADQIEFGDDLEEITQIIDVPESEKRFSIDMQVDDMLDEMLSTIPNVNRTRSVLNNIHLIIERYKQVREDYSELNRELNTIEMITKGSHYKPLVESLKTMNKKLFWLIPIVKNIKTIYDTDVIESSQFNDIKSVSTGEIRTSEHEIIENYLTNIAVNDDNKIDTLMNGLNPLMKPFSDPTSKDDVIVNIPVKDDILGIVDNLGDYHSMVFNNSLVKTRFFTQMYNTGMTRLHATELRKGYMNTKRIDITPNDSMSIKSFLKLPMEFIKFSNINLPNTNLLHKSLYNSSFVNYWKYLNSSSDIKQEIIYDFDSPVKFEKVSYLSDNIDFVLNTDELEGNYEKYLNHIIPDIKGYFDIINPYIELGVNFKTIIDNLQPFLIYGNDINFKQYQHIVNEIEEHIKLYKRFFIDRRSQMLMIKNFRQKELTAPNFLSKRFLTQIESDSLLQIKTSYKLPDLNYTDSEIISKLKETDNMSLYALILSEKNLHLHNGTDMNEIISGFESKQKASRKANRKENVCKNYILAKKYLDYDELVEDNGKEIYFDKKYDDTPYSYLDDYKAEYTSMEKSSFVKFLMDKLINSVGLTKENAKNVAKNIYSGKKTVLDGHYALLNTDDDNKYYKRQENKWFEDTELGNELYLDENDVFCNVNLPCINVNQQCITNDMNKDLTNKENLKMLMSEFDIKYNISKEENIRLINSEIRYQVYAIQKIHELKMNELLKYVNQKSNIGFLAEEVSVIVSPYDSLINLILSQSDFVKKQYDIQKFTQLYTRKPTDPEDDIHWLYCNKTNVKLLPMFILRLANTFIQGGDYSKELNLICAEIGEISDDGESWVDKHSGYKIKNREFDTEEGYDEGFKIVSRDIMSSEYGSNLDNTKIKQTDENMLMMSNIMTTVTKYMGITINNMEFLISRIVITMSQILPNEEEYKLKADRFLEKKGKKLPSYEDTKHTTLLYLTLSYLLVGIQVNIPSVKTKKSFPGCIKSFTGYPMDKDQDLTALIYISCVAHKIKSSVKPWHTLKKMNETSIQKKVKEFVDKYVTNDIEISQLINKKVEYLKTEKIEDIPIEHDISNWSTFLPLLGNVKISKVKNVGQTFNDELMSDIANGKSKQTERLLNLRGKIILFSLDVQDDIQGVVKSETPLLTNVSSEPFMENACCNTEEQYNVFNYFARKSDILKTNKTVLELEKIQNKVDLLSKPAIIYHSENTKIPQPVLNTIFNDKLIYKSFIINCKFGSSLPIKSDLETICLSRPEEFNIKLPIEKQIESLKQKGINYNNDSLKELLKIISRRNFITENLIEKNEFNKMDVISGLLDSIGQSSDDVIPGNFVALLQKIITSKDNTKHIRDLKNYLSKTNNLIKSSLGKFIRTNSKLNKTMFSKVEGYLNTLLNNEKEISKENQINNLINVLINVSKIFPNIIINNLDIESISIPRHWKLSDVHNKDVRNILLNQYEKINSLYGNKYINRLLEDLDLNFQNITNFAHIIIYLNDVLENDVIIDILKYFIMIVFNEYMQVNSDLTVEKSEADDSYELFSPEDILNKQSGQISQIEIVKGNQVENKEKVSNMLHVFILILISQNKSINYTYSDVMNLVLRSKEKEKDSFTTYLKDLTDEEREIESLFKNHKLEKWSKGIQKGLVQYDKDTYDNERETMEKQVKMELSLGKMDVVSDMNRDIFMLDKIQEEQTEDLINREELTLQGPDDDDHGDMDGDEYY